jgi:hypothetical protein
MSPLKVEQCLHEENIGVEPIVENDRIGCSMTIGRWVVQPRGLVQPVARYIAACFSQRLRAASAPWL